jgi:hypothetical protein
MPLDQLYRSVKSLNLADDRHVKELETRVAELLSFSQFATNVKADGSSHIKIDLGSVSERLPNPLVFALREHWSNNNQSTIFGPPSLTAITHGDLNGDNILVSQGNKGFLIDFFKTGFSPIFRDFVVLESIIKFELIQTLNLAERYQFERDLLMPVSLSDTITVSAELEQNPEVKKVVAAVASLRRLASKVSLSNDPYEYYVGLLFYALKEMVGFSSGSETTCCDVRQFHAFLSAAKISEKLSKRLDQTENRKAISIFLNYASEDLKEVAAIYQKLKAEGHSPWMDDQDIIGGENWRRAIKRVIKDAHLFIPILTKNAVQKRGIRQTEIKWALEQSLEKMAGDIHIIPVRLEPDCEIPEELEHLHCIDLYEPRGWEKLIYAIHEGINRLNQTS